MTDRSASASDLLRQIRQIRDDLDNLAAKQTVELAEHTARTKDEILDEWTQHNTRPTTHPTVQAWVEGWFVHAYARSSAGWGHWCPEWWRHPEAVLRLTVMWQYWERAQRPGCEMHNWYLYADDQFRELTDSRGTFASCGDDGHVRVLPPLKTITVEEGYPKLP
jgi:hypothetical protein